jgi:signal transduction histidine kinase
LRSLVLKLTLAFLLVGLTGSVLTSFMVQQRTQQEFTRLIQNQNQEVLVFSLAQYYQANGNWNGVETVFRTELRPTHPEWDGEGPFEMRRSLFTLADSTGAKVFGGNPDALGEVVPESNLKKGAAIEVGGEVVGWLLFSPAMDRWRPGTPEERFLSGVNSAIFFSALVATVLALVMGGVLAFTLTRSLRELTTATKELAKGKLGHQVEVRSRDEMGDLARSFNQMSAEMARSNQLRKQMTADIAHDLRTPLSVILGYTESFSDGKLEATPETFTVMHREAQHLNGLIEDLKTLSSADAGELPLSYQEISPDTLLRRTAEAYRVKAEQKDITLRVISESDLPQILVDVERMAQVLGNLMSNALRYTPPGGEITLSAGEVEREIRISITDTGAGISPEDLPYVFERSYRGDTIRRQTEGETGLGLSIAKSLVEAQGGEISVESSLGRGTSFTIHLPVSRLG